MRFLAVDVGGTSTRAVVLEDDGACIAYGAAGSGNPTSSGGEKAASSITSASTAAMHVAKLAASDISGAAVAIAGASGEDGGWLHDELVRAGLPACLSLEPDLLAAFHAGTTATAGYALVAGTGSGAVRVRDDRIEATCDGLGWLLGDAGSGFWIGHRAVLATVAALEGRRADTPLGDLVLSRLEIPDSSELTAGGRPRALGDVVQVVYRMRPVELARLAPAVFEAAEDGDVVARGILADAAAALATTLSTVVVPHVGGPLVLGGSILSQPAVADPVVRSFRASRPDTEVVTVSDGLAGAAVLALRHGGVTVDEGVFARIRTSLVAVRGAADASFRGLGGSHRGN